MLSFKVQKTSGKARLGRLSTAHGEIATPVFMPVGTVGSVKGVTPDHLRGTGTGMILGNTYHLMLRPTAEVVAQGDQTTFNQTAGLSVCSATVTIGCLPAGNYMISVTADGFDAPGCLKTDTVTCHVDGFKVDGSWFSLPAASDLVTVSLQPYPLPLATIRARVWNDLQTNGAYDTGEPTLAGFTAKLSDIGGPIQSDWFGNPLCTTYQHDSSGTMLFDADGHPLVAQLGGKCVSNADGDIVIPYMPPQRCSVVFVPPNGQTWHQTTTLEGWHDWDSWAIQGWNGFDPEFVQGGEALPFASFGFVQTPSCRNPATNPSSDIDISITTFVMESLLARTTIWWVLNRRAPRGCNERFRGPAAPGRGSYAVDGR
jgi:hypothetical protein